MRFLPFLLAVMVGLPLPGAETKKDIEYARAGEHSLALDLWLPGKAIPQAPLLVWVHGGAWRAGSKSDMPLRALVNQGYAIASVDYRLSTEAPFPAQIHDIKAAIRFLRAQGAALGVDAARIVICGGSAGGHLAALVGVTNGHQQLEGTVGAHPGKSSAVQGIISFYGGSNLTTILDQSTPHGLKVRIPALQLLLGGQPEEKPDLARLASPVFQVDAKDPPLLLFHGDQDIQMPVNQALELQGAYEKAGLPVKLVVLHGGGHGGADFWEEARMQDVTKFLQSLPES